MGISKLKHSWHDLIVGYHECWTSYAVWYFSFPRIMHSGESSRCSTSSVVAFSIRTLLDGRQEGHPAGKNWVLLCCMLVVLVNWRLARLRAPVITTTVSIVSCCSNIQDGLPFSYRLICLETGPLKRALFVTIVKTFHAVSMWWWHVVTWSVKVNVCNDTLYVVVVVDVAMVTAAAALTVGLTDTSTPVGGSVTFTCQGQGQPVPQYSWYINALQLATAGSLLHKLQLLFLSRD